MIDVDLRLAIEEVNAAENYFNNAKGKKEMNFAINRLMEAKEKLNQIIKEKKKKMEENY